MATYSGTPRTWVAGETVTAALLNSDVRDPLAALSGAWNSYTPTLSQGVTVAKTVSYAKYLQVGKLVIAQVRLIATGAGTSGSAVTVGLPVTAATTLLFIGSGEILDNGSFYYETHVVLASTTTARFRRTDTNPTADFGTDPSMALAANDQIAFHVMYEAA